MDGTHQRGKHPFMKRADRRLAIPNEHGEDISVGLQMKIIREAGISKQEWEDA